MKGLEKKKPKLFTTKDTKDTKKEPGLNRNYNNKDV